jgi:diguanylate cyclase (GGDEF)-like protein
VRRVESQKVSCATKGPLNIRSINFADVNSFSENAEPDNPPVFDLSWRRSRRIAERLVSIRGKLLMAFLCTTLITVGLGVYAAKNIAEGARLVVETFDNSLMSISFARAAAVDFATMEGLAARRRLSAVAATQQELSSRIDDLAKTLHDDLAIAAQRSQSPQAASAAEAVDSLATAWRAAEEAPQYAEPAAVRWQKLDTMSASVAEQVDLLVNYTAGDAFHHREQALRAIDRNRALNIVATLAAMLLSGVTVVTLARRIIRPLAEASAAATRIAGGELKTEIPVGGSDELGVLMRAMTVMRDNIRAMMSHEIAQRRSAQGRLVDAIEGSHEGVMLVDGDGRIVIANSQLGRFFPVIASKLRPGSGLTEVTAEPTMHKIFTSTMQGEVQLDDGRWLRISRSANREGGFVAICGDVTLEKEREAALTQTNRLFDAALSNMSQGLCLYDGEQGLLVSNRQFAELYRLPPNAVRPGLTFREVVGLSVAAGNHEEDLETLYAARMSLVARRHAGTQLQELSDGRAVTISHKPMDDGGWVATYEDVTEQRRSEAQISFLARHDALTELPNRVLFRECLDQALARFGRDHGFALLFIDLDHFKNVNDTLGHPIGDRLLVAVAERLQACVRETDTVARVGGDEFAVVQTGVNRPEDAAELAGRIVRLLGQPFELDEHQVLIGASVGIAVAGIDGTSADTLMKNADLALYRAKQDGRGAYRCFEAEMDARLRERRALEMDLRHAVTNDEFELFFQPLIDVRAEQVSGFEALIRWNHPTRGMVSPVEFIPIAEETGLIVQIGEWVIRTACIEAVSWPDSFKVAVNLSPVQFKSPHLVASVAEALEASGLPARRLELEITESVLLAENDASLATLRRLREIGTHICMDDFGTGYSSLSYLRSFPFDKIKIDQSFVRDLGTEQDTQAIIRAIISLARSLGMRVLAEGVETIEQLQKFSAEGCDELQGYLFSKPRPREELGELIEWLGDKPWTAEYAADQ